MNPNRKKRALWAAALLTLLAIGSAFLLAAKAKREIWLSRNGESLCKIATNSTSASPSDKMAAKELADDLRKITGAAFAVVAEAALAANDKAIYVGQTRFARDQGINFEQLGAEESILRTVNGNLILCGGRPRGTLYAVFAFLESLGCRWYTPWHEKMPRQPQLRVALMDKRIKPFMNMRQGGSDFWRDERTFADKETYQRFHQQYQRYLLHNRVNSGVDFGEAEGGCVKSGGRMSNHSFFAYVPAEKYAQDHPEYFSMRDGKRVPSRDGCDAVHLCLTNPDVLKIVIAGVKEDIQKKPEGQYVSVSINDGGSATICDCPACTKAQEDEGVSGLLLQFVNAVADAIRDEHPDKYILTLAYTSTQQPPKRIRARDNVIVWVCRGALSCAVYLPRGKNAMALDALREWGRHASHLWVWDYAAGSFRTRHYFKPITWKMDEQFKLFKELGTV
ncbi:MAG: DUF4838 domain-containing protein, partial [Verrucomicrobia bacterium]|nr:DUF4838 domain-containing protein [Verrucomicrobiota bacterium]